MILAQGAATGTSLLLGLGLPGLGLLALAAVVQVLYKALSKTLEIERQRVTDLTDALRRRNESTEERVIPALLASAEAAKVLLRIRDSRD